MQLPERVISQLIGEVSPSTMRKVSSKVEADEAEVISVGLNNVHYLFLALT